MLDKLVVIFLSKLFHILRNFFLTNIFTKVIIINLSLHLYKVDNTSKVVFSTNWKLNRNSITL